jgi:ATP-dependent helicase Lhr and Lhr-like helicase
MIMNAFERLAPFIKNYIYKNKWDELREIQVAACDVIFNTNDNLLLSSGTASGKTEAAFLPILTELFEKPSKSIGILYISPLKSLINDQFYRLEDLLLEVDIPVTKWHGDVSADKKKKILNCPKGILQITPESLESMLLNRKGEIVQLFSDLRFIIIDEVHYFMGNDRGIQLLSILERISRLTGNVPRRVGLSATLGDYSCAIEWLNAGTIRKCSVPSVRANKRIFRLAVEYFIIEKNNDIESDYIEDDYYQYIYKRTIGKKCIVFANSRQQVEHTVAVLKHIAIKNSTADIYRIHHGNISAGYREDTEKEMKDSEQPIVTGATLTLELGVDIGTLDRIVQLQSPFTVSSFVQRLGRCGRRGKPAEMFFVFASDNDVYEDLMENINWQFLKCIAIIQLYIREQWIEPSYIQKCPFSLLYHQTMSYIASMGEVSAAGLAQYILSLFPFQYVTQNDYKILLTFLLEIEQLEKSERGGLIIGVNGEKVVSHYDFYSVFKSPQEYSVKWENKTVGTVETLFSVGDQFELAGNAWEVIDISEKSHIIYVNSILGISKISWSPKPFGNLDTKVVQEMYSILCSEEKYSYLSDKAYEELNEFRQLIKKGNIHNQRILETERMRQYRIFPWIGTKGLRGFSLALKKRGIDNKISYHGIWLEVDFEGTINELENTVRNIINTGIEKQDIELEDDMEISGKYNIYVPKCLLQKQYIIDNVDVTEMQTEIKL